MIYQFENMKDKVCVITGGSGVIGSSLAKGLASVGIKTAILGRRKAQAEKTASEIIEETGTESFGFGADVLDKKALEKTKQEINSKLGKVDLLINCAGGNSPKVTTKYEFIDNGNFNDINDGFFGLDIDGFREVFDLNFLGTLLPTMIFSKDMLEQKNGAILNISSLNAFKPLTKIPAYSAAKASVNNFTEWLAVHFAKINIRVNAIAPGFFLTNQNRFLLIDEKTSELTERGKKIINGTPMGKFGEPSDLVGTTLFLLSDLSNFITGVVIPIDGGFNAYSGV